MTRVEDLRGIAARSGTLATVERGAQAGAREPDTPLLLDRERELLSISSMLVAIREGLSGTLVLRGEPGIGKTAVLDHAVSSAGELSLARVTGVEPELQLGFAGLHRLLIPLLGRLERLPLPQRRALQSAFGLVNDDPSDRFMVSLAVLTLLDDAAAANPLLVIVDDAQWLDRESLETLAFVARRLHADRVAMLFATAEQAEATHVLDALPSLDLAGLSAEATTRLLRALAGRPVDDRVARRIAAETRGNPLAIAELAGELSAAQLVGASCLPEPLPVGGRLEERFLRRVRELPDEAQTLLLLAAAASPLDRALLQSAAARAGIDIDAAIEQGAEGFLIVEEEVRFRHPLKRAAIYSGATGPARRRAHEVLAAVSDAAGDFERRAWHRAAAAVGPDEDTAAELDRAAERARVRGGYAATTALLARAAELTPDSSRRAERLLRTAQAELFAGDADGAQAKLDEATGGLVDARQRAEARRAQGAIELARGRGADAPATLLAAASEFSHLDPRPARTTLLEALEAAMMAGRFARGGGLAEVAAAARAMPRKGGCGELDDLLLDAFATRAASDYAAGVPLMREAVARLHEQSLPVEDGLRRLGLGCCAAGELFDEESYSAFAVRWAKLAREAGALTVLPRALAAIAHAEIQAGCFGAADAALAERCDIASATGDPTVLGAAAPVAFLLSAWRGEAEDTRTGAERLMREASARGQGNVIACVRSALVVLDVGLGEYEAALGAALSVYEEDSPFLGTRVLPDLVEAAARCEQPDIADAALGRLSRRALQSAGELALGLLARSRALSSDDDGAEELYREALTRLAQTRAAPELGRSHLLYGEWLRRRRRRRDAREQLRLAHRLFESLGAGAFAQRAAAELLATGERARRRDDSTRDELTPQETRIANLAAEGASNSEIGEKLFISSSTVAYHLRKVFRKLEVSSRARLAGALASDDQDCPSAATVTLEQVSERSMSTAGC